MTGASWPDYRPVDSVLHADAVSLIDLVRSDPEFMLGESVANEYGPRLPYLLKVLAAAGPLSLQVHPKPHIARAGFSRENREGIDLHSPERNYKDDQHKPEMILALTPFEGLSGFRRPERAAQLLAPVAGPTAAAMRDILTGAGVSDTRVRQAFDLAIGLRAKDARAELDAAAESIADAIAHERGQGRQVSRGLLTALDLSKAYPGDPGMLVSLLLNRFSLKPGEAVFLRAGQVHAYLNGLGVEIMASSDNVLRAGLTTKRVDVPQLLECTDFAPEPAVRPTLRSIPGGLTEYRVPAPEFSLVYGEVNGTALVNRTGPRIVLCLEGEITVTNALGELGKVATGQSVFVPHGVGSLGLAGRGTVAVSYVP